MSRRRTSAVLPPLALPLVLAAVLTACADQPQPSTAADPYADGQSFPWSDRLDQPAPSSDPYAGGRSYPWTGLTLPAPGFHTAALASPTFVSDLTWTSAVNAWGPVEKDQSNGEQEAGGGHPLTIGGQTFQKGLGVHAGSTVSYALEGACSTFQASVGVDAEVGNRGSVTFQVWNGTASKLYDSGVLRGGQAPQAVSVNVTGVNDLRLVVTDAGDGISYDHADWANAQLSCAATAPSSDTSLSSLVPTSATNGWGPIEKNQSNGEQGSNDGRPITIGGQSFALGLGVHANSAVTYGLQGQCSIFRASVGIDAEVGNRGSVIFQVWNGTASKLYDSGALRGGQASQAVNVNVTGVQSLRLVVTDAGDGIGYDHADWASPVVTCAGQPLSPLSWPARASAPTKLFEGQGAVVDGRLYVFGGFDRLSSTGNPLATLRCWAYEPASDRWFPLADLPEKITHGAIAVDGQTVYLVGGFVGDNPGPETSHVWKYDMVQNRWSAGVPLPAGRAGGGAAIVNRELHYFGGTARDPKDTSVYLRDYGDQWVLPLDGGTAWTSAAPMPNPRNHMAGIALNGVIYAIGGQHLGQESSGNQTEVDAYTVGQGWTRLADLPQPTGHIGAATVVWNGRIVVAGGATTGDVKSDRVFEYDPAGNRWSDLTPLPAPRQAAVAGVVNNGLVVTGGENTSGPTSTTWLGTR